MQFAKVLIVAAMLCLMTTETYAGTGDSTANPADKPVPETYYICDFDPKQGFVNCRKERVKGPI